jgi:hypothetical protein
MNVRVGREDQTFQTDGISRFLTRSGQVANFRFGQEHRTFLSVNEFHYLTRC